MRAARAVRGLLGRLPFVSRWGELGRVAKTAVAVAALALLGFAAAAGFAGYVYAMWRSAPDLSSLEQRDNGENSTLYADDGTRLGVVQSQILRKALDADEIPALVKDATVAAEDRRFFEHEGVDFKAVLRAAFENVRAGAVVQGGSTLTQQVIRNLYITDERTLARKVKEAKLASEMEDQVAKQRILTLYLNNVAYGTVNGQSSIGIHAAARTFFGKPVGDLELHEAALLAGLPRAPSLYNPFRHEEAARERRRQVLEAMAESGKVSRAQAQAATRRPLGVERGDFYTRRHERYFFEYVKQSLIDRYGERRVERGGLDVYTTVDVDLQQQARKAIRSVLDRDGDPAAAAVSVEPGSGHIKAMATSERYSREQFNLAASAKRQLGSAIKPVVLMTALRRGVDPERTTYESKRLNLDHPRHGEIEVRNFGGRYRGDINLIEATIKSDNAVYQQLALDLGLDAVKENARRIGLSGRLQGRPAEALGGLEHGVSPLDVARAYATLAGGGVRVEAKAVRRVSFPDGSEERLGEPARERVYEPAVTRKATEMLALNVVRGTATRARIGCPAAAKTGTTDDYRDAWLAGYTPGLATAVWVGYPQPKPMRDVHGIAVSGGTLPAEIWGRYMRAVSGDDCERFEPLDEAELDLEPFCARYATTPACDDEQEEEGDSNRSRAGGGDDGGGGGDQGRGRRGDGGREEQPRDRDGETGAERDGEGGDGKGDGGGEGGGDGGDRPETRIDSAPPRETSKRTAEFKFSSPGGDDQVRFECRLDDRPYRSCRSPKRYEGLERGEHRFQVRAVDREGRRDRSPASHRWVIRPGAGSG